MAVSYPRALPQVEAFDECRFTLQRYTNVNVLDGGVTQVVEYAPPRWRAEYSAVVNDRQRYLLEAWWLSLQDGLQSFLGYDVIRPKPFAYRNTSIPDLTGVTLDNVSGDHIGFNGLPSGFDITEGDWVSLTQSGNRMLLRALETKTKSTSPFNFDVQPAPLTNVFTTAANFDFDQPLAEFLPEIDSLDINRLSGGVFRARWSGIQKLF